MEEPGNQTAGQAEDPPPPPVPAQDRSVSESLLDSTADSGQSQRHPPPPPSPLTGCYLLIVIGEPHSDRHKEIILQKISKGFLSWDVSECHVSLEKELQSITVQSPEGEEARYGERLIQYATENLVTEILIHPQLNTLHQCMKNLLSSFTKHRHIIHAGYTFAGNGSWILQDGTLSISDLVEALHEAEVLRVLKAYENSVTIDVHCAREGDWTTERFQKEPVSRLCKIRINPGDVMTAGDPTISSFIDYLSPFLEPANIQQLLQPTDVVGNIRFTHPTLYVFPGGQGDAALFGINGFNMLVDGGFSRKACFWDFARHLDRLDAVLLTRLNNSTVNGISAVLQRKTMNHVYPQIGHFFCNLQDRKIALSPDGDKDKDSLIVNLAEEGQEIVANLKHLALKPHPCYRDGNQVDPVNLYHKVGHGKLDMYVISPARDSQAVKEFLSKWSANDNQLFSNTGKKLGANGFDFPIQNLVSICALLVWQPANPNDTITRILFPGSTPQHKIFEGLDKLRHLEFLKHPVCSARSISPSASVATVTRSLSKSRQPEERPKPRNADNAMLSKPEKPRSKPVKQVKQPVARLKSDTNKLADGEESKLDGIYDKDEKIESITKEIQKIQEENAIQRIETDLKKMDQPDEGETEKQAKKIIHRSKFDMKNVKSKIDTRAPSKSIDRKKMPEKKVENGSPPATPKKALPNGTSAPKTEKSRSLSRTSKSSPSATPGKSVKEANNRKVVEARVISRTAKAATATPKPIKKEEPVPATSVVKTERKPISRRPKAASPVKKATLSPIRRAKPGKPEVEAIAKKIKRKLPTDLEKTGTDSTVSTPSAEIEPKREAAKEPLQVAQEAKTDLEVTTEAETIQDSTENKETDQGAVKGEESPPKETIEIEMNRKEDEDEEEYLIITKEEPSKVGEDHEEGDSLQEDGKTKDETEGEGEIKKIHQDEEDSEKKRMMKEQEEADKKEVPSEESPRKEEKESEQQRLTDMDEGIDMKEPGSKEQKEGESLPDEKFSTTVETSATTAPTLPEDEKIEEPEKVEEVKEEPEEAPVEVIEEKYVKEEIKDEVVAEKPSRPEQPIPLETMPEPAAPVSEVPQQRVHPRDLVKTPDEVADLPVHEEVDPGLYGSGEFNKELQKRPEEQGSASEEVSEKEPAKYKEFERGEANLLDEKEEETKDESELKKLSDDLRETEKEPEEKSASNAEALTNKYLDIIDQLEKTNSPEKVPVETAHGEASVVKISKAVEEELPGMQSVPADFVQVEEVVEKDSAAVQESAPEVTSSDFGASPMVQLGTVDAVEEATQQLIESENDWYEKDSKPAEEKLSGKSTPKEVHSGKLSPVTLANDEASGKPENEKSTPEGTGISGRASPVLPEGAPSSGEKIVSGTTSPAIKEEAMTSEITQVGKSEAKDISGSESPVEEKSASGKVSPSGSASPKEKESLVPSIKDTFGKASPIAGEKVSSEVPGDTSGALSPAVEEKVSDEPVTPRESSLVPSEVSSSPQQEVDFGKETSLVEKMLDPASTQERVDEVSPEMSSPKDSPKVAEKEAPSPVPEEKDTSGKEIPVIEDKLASAKISPEAPESAPESMNISGKTTPEKLTSGKASPVGKESPRCPSPIAEHKAPSAEKMPEGMKSPVELEASPEEKIESGKTSPSAGSGKYQELPERRASGGEKAPDETVVSGSPEEEKTSPETQSPSPPEDKSTSGIGSQEEFLSGKVTPVLEKVSSGKTTPTPTEEVLKTTVVLSGKTTPDKTPARSGESSPVKEKAIVGQEHPTIVIDAEKEASEDEDVGKSTPSKERFGEGSPVEKEEPSSAEKSGTHSPAASERDASGKGTPVPIEDSEKIAAGKVTPEVAESGEGTPAIDVSCRGTESPLEPSGKRTPVADTEKVTSDSVKASPAKVEKQFQEDEPRQSSEKDTPDEGATSARKESPQDEEVIASGKGSPMMEDTGKVTPMSDKATSGKETPILPKDDSGKVTPAISGKATPVLLGDEKGTPSLSGKGTPAPSEQEASPVLSGTPAISERDASSPMGKESPVSGKEAPEADTSAPATAKDACDKEAEKDISGKETLGLSTGKRTPVPSESGPYPVDKEASPDKMTPPQTEHPETALSEKEGKESSEKEKSSASDKSPSPETIPEKTSVTIRETSGHGTPISSEKDVSNNISSVSGKESPERDTSGKTTPGKAGKAFSGTSTPGEEPKKDLPHPEVLGRMIFEKTGLPSGKSTPLEAIKSSSMTSSLPESPATSSGLVSPAPSTDKKDESGKLSASGKSTPLDRSLGNGIDELEKGTLESERHEKESQLTDDISSGEEEELKALEQEGDDSEPEPDISRDRLQSLEGASATPESHGHKSSTPAEHITMPSPKGKKDDINNLVKSSGDADNQAAVKRMLVTASSEDGGTETEICAQGSIRLSKTEMQLGREMSADSSDDERKEEFGSLISRARKEYNLQRSRKTSSNTPEHGSSDEQCDIEDDDVIEDEPGRKEEFGSLILQAQREYNLQRSRISSRNSPEEEEVPEESVCSSSVARKESCRVDENDPTIMITTILTEEREEQEVGTFEKTEVVAKEEGKMVTVRQEESEGGAVVGSLEVSPLKTTYIGDGDSMMTSSFYGSSGLEEEVLEYRREKGYESFIQIGPDGQKTEKTYFYTADPEVSSTSFMRGIPEAIPEAPEITFETFPTRDTFVPEDFAKAMDEHKSVRGEYLGQTAPKPETGAGEKAKDVVEGWGKPLGLPLPPKMIRNAGQNISTTSSLSTPSDNSDSVTNWGHPMNLPSPIPPTTQNATETPKKRPAQPKKTTLNDNKSSGNNTPSRRSESPIKQQEKRASSIGRKTGGSSYLYLDLTYVPHHGNSYYSNVEFFKRVRARYYVFSGTEPSKEVYNALLEAKQTWEDKDLEVTIIPTYDTDILGYWVAENEEVLAKNKIDLSPSASRCTINLQDHETSCSAYRLEF